MNFLHLSAKKKVHVLFTSTHHAVAVKPSHTPGFSNFSHGCQSYRCSQLTSSSPGRFLLRHRAWMSSLLRSSLRGGARGAFPHVSTLRNNLPSVLRNSHDEQPKLPYCVSHLSARWHTVSCLPIIHLGKLSKIPQCQHIRSTLFFFFFKYYHIPPYPLMQCIAFTLKILPLKSGPCYVIILGLQRLMNKTFKQQ